MWLRKENNQKEKEKMMFDPSVVLDSAATTVSFSWIYNVTKTYSASFLFMVGVSVVGILLGLKLKKTA